MSITPVNWESRTAFYNGEPVGYIIYSGAVEIAQVFDDKDGETNADAIAAVPQLIAALKMQVNWRMRDGSPCACPAGQNEDERKGKMPTIHATSCEDLRAALRAAGEES